MSSRKNRRAVTILDLMTSVALLGVIGSIGTVAYTEAEVRTNAAVARNDLRVIAVAMESYQIDHAMYPPNVTNFMGLLTPIRYLNGFFPPDPFTSSSGYFIFNLSPWDEVAVEAVSEAFPGQPSRQSGLFRHSYVMLSTGPDGRFSFETLDGDEDDPLVYADLIGWLRAIETPGNGMVYDPTNGTLSGGDIGRTAGGHML